MPDDWTNLANQYGRKSVMSLAIDDATLDRETQRQIPILFGMIADQLHGHERSGLDYGCGAGRWTHALAKTIQGRVTGFDPCTELVAMARGEIDTDYVSGSPDAFFGECRHNEPHFDVVLAAQVLGAPGMDVEATARGLVGVLAPGGLLVVVDHMVDEPQPQRWWRFRSRDYYESLFSRHGIELREIGRLMQLENEITMLAGRNAG